VIEQIPENWRKELLARLTPADLEAIDQFVESRRKAGVEIYEYQPTMLHQKTMIVDGVWATVGTANFDNRSFSLNEETNICFHDAELIAQLRAVFFADLARALQSANSGMPAGSLVTGGESIATAVDLDRSRADLDEVRERHLLTLDEGHLMAFDYPVARPIDLLVNGSSRFTGHIVAAGRKRGVVVEVVAPPSFQGKSKEDAGRGAIVPPP